MRELTRLSFFVLASLELIFIAITLCRQPHKNPGASCSLDTLMEVMSPDRSHVALMKNEKCDTGKLETIVFLENHDNVFANVFDTGAGIRQGGSFTPPPLRITWTSNLALLIEYPHEIVFARRIDDFDGVTVSYRELPVP